MAKPDFPGKQLKRAVTNMLHKAAQSGQVDRVRQLIAEGEDVNGRDKHKNTPLFWAAFSQDLDVAKILVAAGANINAVGPHGTTPLHNALFQANIPLSLWLIEQGANVHTCDTNGNSILHITALSLSKEVAKVLFEKGLDVNVRNERGFSPLSLAAVKTQTALPTIFATDFIFFLLDAGAQYHPLPGLNFSLENSLLKQSNLILLQETLNDYSQNATRSDVREFAQKMQDLVSQKAANMKPQSIQSSILGHMEWKKYAWEASPVAVPFYNNELMSVLYKCTIEKDPAFLEEADVAMKAFLSKTTADRLQLSPQVASFAIMNIQQIDFSDYDINDEDSWLGFRDTSIDDTWLEAFVAGKKDVQHVWNMLGKPGEILVARPEPGKPVYVAIVWECLWDIEDRFQLSFKEGKELARVSAADGDLVD